MTQNKCKQLLYTLSIFSLAFLPTLFIMPTKGICLGCGIMPIPPLGCKKENAKCVCNADGECSWIFENCGYVR